MTTDSITIAANPITTAIRRLVKNILTSLSRTARSEEGINVLDLLVYIGMVGILAGGIIPSLIHARNASNSSRAESDLANVNLIIGLYYNDYYYYPGASSGAVSNTTVTAAALGAAYPTPPMDPLTHGAYTLSVTTTAGVVAYEIDAPGVYDATTLTNINNGTATTKTGIAYYSNTGFAPK